MKPPDLVNETCLFLILPSSVRERLKLAHSHWLKFTGLLCCSFGLKGWTPWQTDLAESFKSLVEKVPEQPGRACSLHKKAYMKKI